MKKILFALLALAPFTGFSASVQFFNNGQPILSASSVPIDTPTFVWSFGLYSGDPVVDFAQVDASFTDLATSASTGNGFVGGTVFSAFTTDAGSDGEQPAVLIWNTADTNEFLLFQQTAGAGLPAIGTGQYTVDLAGGDILFGSQPGGSGQSVQLGLIPEPSSVLFAGLAGFLCFFRRSRK